jgi:triosephosphate isomerase
MPSVTIGVSFKSYFDRQRARTWCAEVAAGVRARPAVAEAEVRVFVIPSYLQIDDAVRAFTGTPVGVGAQDVSRYPAGAYTGEVSASELAESGVGYAEIGHAERRRLLGETDQDTAAKAAAALGAGLTPVLCIGEADPADPAAAARATVTQLAADLAGAPAGPVVVAYEPVWAIGAPQPASREHITTVIRALREALDAMPDRVGSAVIYGGSAGPGLLTELGAEVDGLFLGRFAHEPAAFLAVLDEAAARTERSAA